MSLAEEERPPVVATTDVEPSRSRLAPAAPVAAAVSAPIPPAVAAAAPPPPSPSVEAAPVAPAKARSKRKVALAGVALAALVGGVAYAVYYFMVLAHFESTDNAYVQGNVVQLTPQVSGTVVAINADDTDFVKRGQSMVRLDPADAQVVLEQAEAQLAQTVREVRTLFVNNGTWKAQIAAREADLARARNDVQRAEDDVNRRAPLVKTGAVGQEEFNHVTSQLSVARSAMTAAESATIAAREQLASNQSLTDNVTVEMHPNVLRAAAKVREGYLAVSRNELVAPVDGYVARRSVQLGQRVQAGAPLLSIVPLSEVWVDANFKEVQLRNLRIDQPVTLEADVYGKKVEYHGRVEGLGAGTGAAFALLPAQNATGNWIKVVQRVPVRIALDPKEVQEHPLRVGLSMDVKVDVAKTDGRVLADVSQRPARAQTSVFDRSNELADAEVKKIIAANLGRRVSDAGDAKAVAARSAPSPSLAPAPAPAVAQAPAPVASR